MERYDPQLAARVWQRVTAGTEPVPTGNVIPELISHALTNAAVFRALSRQMGSRLDRLARQEQSQAACLRGIRTAVDGASPAIRIPSPPREPPLIALRKAYVRSMQSLKQYEARTGDPEYGPVYARLAQEKHAQCQTILELLGSLPRR